MPNRDQYAIAIALLCLLGVVGLLAAFTILSIPIEYFLVPVMTFAYIILVWISIRTIYRYRRRK